jgi:hypothetical protein
MSPSDVSTSTDMVEKVARETLRGVARAVFARELPKLSRFPELRRVRQLFVPRPLTEGRIALLDTRPPDSTTRCVSRSRLSLLNVLHTPINYSVNIVRQRSSAFPPLFGLQSGSVAARRRQQAHRCSPKCIL